MRTAMRCAGIALAVSAIVHAGSARADESERWYAAAHGQLETGLTVLLVRREDGTDWVRVVDLKLLGVEVPSVFGEQHQGEVIVPLDAVAGARVDPETERVYFADTAGQHKSDEDAPVELIVDMVVNGQAVPVPQIIRHERGRVWLSPDSLVASRLVPQKDAITDHNGWTLLRDLAGTDYVLDPERLRLEVMVPPGQFVPTRIDLAHAESVPTGDPQAGPFAAIIGYDAAMAVDAQGARTRSLIVDGTISRGQAHCRSRHLGRSGRQWARLDTQCILDWPQQRLSLTLGDAVSRDYALSGSVRYGGIRLGTDFSLQPQLQLQPLLSVEGSARLPSVLEVWVEQRLATRTEVAPGDFLVDGVPAMTGSGEVDAVIVDALGRRTIVSAPYYASPALLRPNLSDWTLEVGRTRTGFLSNKDRYGDLFGLFNWRRGLAPWWTVQLRVELTERGSVLGAVNHVTVGASGVAELAAARSRHGGVSANAYALGYHYQDDRWSIGVRTARHSRGYTDIAYLEPGQAPSRESRASFGVRIGRAALSAGGLLRELADGRRLKYARAGLNMPLGEGYFGLSVLAPMGNGEDALYSGSYTLPLGQSRSLSAWASHSGGPLEPGVMMQRSLPAGLGHGYRLSHRRAEDGGTTALSASYRGNVGQIDFDARHGGHGTDSRLSAKGALVVIEEGVFPTQSHDASFAIVSLPEEGVGVFRDNQLAARTNGDGHAIVPKLRPHQRNKLRLDVEGVTLSTRIESPQIDIVPGRRQVVRAEFGASKVRALLLRLVRSNGERIPTGAVVQPSVGESVPVGFDGIVYLELEGDPTALRVDFKGQPLCRVPVEALSLRPAGEVHETLCEGADVL